MALERAEIRMIGWVCGVKVVTDRFTCNELKERLGTGDIITVLNQNIS